MWLIERITSSDLTRNIIYFIKLSRWLLTETLFHLLYLIFGVTYIILSYSLIFCVLFIYAAHTVVLQVKRSQKKYWLKSIKDISSVVFVTGLVYLFNQRNNLLMQATQQQQELYNMTSGNRTMDSSQQFVILLGYTLYGSFVSVT